MLPCRRSSKYVYRSSRRLGSSQRVCQHKLWQQGQELHNKQAMGPLRGKEDRK